MQKHPIAEIIAAVFWSFWYDTSLTGTLWVFRLTTDMIATKANIINEKVGITEVNPSYIWSVDNMPEGIEIIKK